jgi:hypothetical protein
VDWQNDMSLWGSVQQCRRKHMSTVVLVA